MTEWELTLTEELFNTETYKVVERYVPTMAKASDCRSFGLFKEPMPPPPYTCL